MNLTKKCSVKLNCNFLLIFYPGTLLLLLLLLLILIFDFDFYLQILLYFFVTSNIIHYY
ncbi:hypothetical protein H8356DRAFT_1629805 [Neocallimastix lanati (nom. inval.)]|nr:hypothetical protein H8356DRAFT_1629805 [Neocallimastix sp. JGI-2020a]